jgi:phosphomevalonate kinase
MIKISAPGKLFLSGEWSVLEVGNPGIVMSVNKRVHAEIEESEKIKVIVNDFSEKEFEAEFDGKELEWKNVNEEEKEYLKFMKGSIETVLQYLGEHKNFKIRSWGDLSEIILEDGKSKKVGFGSSAASVVAAIGGILALHGHDIEKREVRDVIYKLSAIAHYFVQGKVGSAFDVAASTYGGVFVYKRFDAKWLIEQMESGKSIKDVVGMEWPEFYVEELEIPEGFRLLIGWTKESASTSAMVKQLNEWAKQNQDEYKRLYDQIANLVRELIPAWKEKDKDKILEFLRMNETFLRELGERSGVSIETPDLKKLSEDANQHGAAGKLSGAGGGDCGIAVCFDYDTAEKVLSTWKENGFYIVDAGVDHSGIKKE